MNSNELESFELSFDEAEAIIADLKCWEDQLKAFPYIPVAQEDETETDTKKPVKPRSPKGGPS